MPDVSAADLPGAYVRDVVALAARWQVPAASLLAGLPLSETALDDPATRVPIAVCAEVAERARRLTGEPALAVYAGWHMRISTHGFLGFAAMTAGTLREAIALATRFTAIRTPALGLALYVEGQAASLVVEERAELGALREFALLSLLVGLWRIGQALTGQTLSGTAEFAFDRPAYLDRALAPMVSVRFGRPTTRLVFPSAQLDLPLETADPVAAQLVLAQCERELGRAAGAALPARVRALLAARADGTPALAEVARALHLSPRTLKRKLAEHGTGFSALVRDVRRERALLLLDDHTLSIAEVATRVGYSEVPNFSRAFRAWTGQTPAAYREQRLARRYIGVRRRRTPMY